MVVPGDYKLPDGRYPAHGFKTYEELMADVQSDPDEFPLDDPQRGTEQLAVIVSGLLSDLAQLRRELAAAQAELRATDELTRHLVECPECQQKNCGEMFWDDCDCNEFSRLLEAEAEARAALRAERPGAAETESDDPHTPQGATGDTE